MPINLSRNLQGNVHSKQLPKKGRISKEGQKRKVLLYVLVPRASDVEVLPEFGKP